MSNYIYTAQYVSGLSIVIGSIIFIKIFNTRNNYKIVESIIPTQNSTVDNNLELLIFSSTFVIINIFLCYFVSKFPIRIYFNENTKTYMGFMLGFLPKTKKSINFKVGDIISKEKSGILPWKQFEYRIKNGQNIILLEQYFRRPQDMNIMLGYTKL